MQDMTSDICNATPAPTAEDIKNKTYDEIITDTPSKQLKDSRDGKYYWVSKLADGNCWMTQDLDFDIPAALYREDSDVLVDTLTDINAITAPSGWSGTDNTLARYYDPGDYIYNGSNNNPHAQGTRCDTSKGLSECATAYPGEWTTSTANIDAFGNIDNHYHVGNYYSWSAATVKSGNNLTTEGTSAPNSICPKSWKLPTSDTSGQFAKLLTEYGVNTDLTNGDYAVYKEPLYFVYGGLLSSGVLYNTSDSGLYWSSTIASETHAFPLYFAAGVNPAYSYLGNRYYGFSVRCVAE